MTKKSPLDEFIDLCKSEFVECFGSIFPESEHVSPSLELRNALKILELNIRLAVQKHAEAVQNAVSFKSNVGEEFDSKFNNQIREEIQSVSDKWIGV